jgi:hypothetical protein
MKLENALLYLQDHTLSQPNHAQILIPCLFKIRFNIIFPSTPRFLKVSLSFRFEDQNVLYISRLSHARYLSISSWINHCNNTMWKVNIVKFLIT